MRKSRPVATAWSAWLIEKVKAWEGRVVLITVMAKAWYVLVMILTYKV